MSRERILNEVLTNQPKRSELPGDLNFEPVGREEMVSKFVEMITLIGGNVVRINQLEDIDQYVAANFKDSDEKIALIPGLLAHAVLSGLEVPHHFSNLAFAVFETHFAVAENGAVWITEERLGHRVLPFITQHLGMLVRQEAIVANMHEAYQLIDTQDYGFGTFIAGPSKTADIEQSLVLGAHGARSMTIFLW